LFTRATISSTVLPAFGSTGCVPAEAFGFCTDGFTTFGAGAAGGLDCEAGCGFSCAAIERAAHRNKTTVNLRIHFSHPISLALPLKTEQYVSQDRWDRLAAFQFNPQHATGIQLDARARPHHRNQLRRIERRFGMEAHGNARSLALHRGNPQALANGFEDGIL